MIYPEVKVPMTRSINWAEYVPARPPSDGEYLVVYKHDKQQKTTMAKFFNASYTWISVEENVELILVTHYVRVELP